MQLYNHHNQNYSSSGNTTNLQNNNGGGSVTTPTTTPFEDEFFTDMFTHPHHHQASPIMNVPTDDYSTQSTAFMSNMLPPHHHQNGSQQDHGNHHQHQHHHQAIPFFSNLIRMHNDNHHVLPASHHQQQYHHNKDEAMFANKQPYSYHGMVHGTQPQQHQYHNSSLPTQDEGTEQQRVGLRVRICDPSGAIVEGCKRDKKYQIIVESCAQPVGCRELSLTLIGLTKHAVLNPETRLIKTASQIIQQFKIGQPIEALVQRSGVIPIHSICFDTLGNPTETSFPSILKGKATNDHVWELGKPFVKNTNPRTYSIDLVFKISSNDNSALLHKFQKGYIVLVQGNCINDAVSTRIHQVAKNLKRSLNDQYYNKGKMASTTTSTTSTGAVQVQDETEEEETKEVYPLSKKQKLKEEYSMAHEVTSDFIEPSFECRWIRLKVLHTSKDNTNQVHTEFPLALHKNKNSITIGRAQSCDFCINDSLMSPEHFKVDFQIDTEQHSIQNIQLTPLSNKEIRLRRVGLNSNSSSWERVTCKTTLSIGDQILLGMTKLKLIDIMQDE